MSLVDQIKELKERHKEDAVTTAPLSPAALRALKLSEEFEYIEPEPYVLPLDALAGFPMQSRAERR